MRCALVRPAALRATVWRRALQPLAEWLDDDAGSPAPEPSRAQAEMRQLLTAPRWPWHNWRMASVERCSLRELERWFGLENRTVLDDAARAGRGVILANAHFGSGLLMPAVLARWGIELASIQHGGQGAGLREADARRLHALEVDPARPGDVLAEARRVLETGGVLHVAPDGLFGRGGVELGFLGRRRTFRTGFARLALESGAPVLPLVAPTEERGATRVRILEPLAPRESPADPGEPVESAEMAPLVRAYAEHLERLWTADPGNVDPRHLGLVASLEAVARDERAPEP